MNWGRGDWWTEGGETGGLREGKLVDWGGEAGGLGEGRLVD